MQKKSAVVKPEIRIVVDAETMMRLRKKAMSEKSSATKVAQKILNTGC